MVQCSNLESTLNGAQRRFFDIPAGLIDFIRTPKEQSLGQENMKRILNILLVGLLWVHLPTVVTSQDYETLYRDFDSNALTRADKRFLQTALAFEGHYNGLLDGDWGGLSRRALQGYSRQEFGTESEDWHMAMLAWSFFELAERDGWDIRYFSSMGTSLLWPEKTIVRDPATEFFQNYHHSQSSLSLSMSVSSQQTTQSFHDFTAEQHAIASKPYSVRKSNLAVTSATKADGSTLYTRSDFVQGAWSTVILSAKKWDGPILNAVAASISVGRAEHLSIAKGGRLEDAIQKTIALVNDQEDAPQTSNQKPSKPPNDEPKSGNDSYSGSGFVVSENGHVMTNAHVVNECSMITVDGEPAELLSASDEFDLALLYSEGTKNKTVAVFAASSAKLNSDVTAIGFPYAGLLGGINVTRGSVSSLKGLGGNLTTMQITSPVQSGNSGGPLLSSDGEVVGVVVSKLDAAKVSDAMGDVPQNVNFAVRGEIAKLFLAQNGVDAILSITDDRLEPEVLAEKARGFTVFIECR